MARSTVHLTRLRIASRRHNLEANLRGSIEVNAPDGLLLKQSTVNELAGAVANQHIWVARTGSCNLVCSTSIGVRGNETRSYAEAIQGCEIWDRLGLQLVDSSESAADPPEAQVFSIQHDDLSSVLVAPEGALRADFISLSLSIEVSEIVRPEPRLSVPAAKKKGVKRRRTSGSGASDKSNAHGHHQDIFDTLPMDDQRAIDNFLLSLNRPSRDCTVQRGAAMKGLGAAGTVDWAEGRSLVQSTIKFLVLGNTQRHLGIKILEGAEWQGLSQLLPGVFHMPYLKNIKDRAQYIPILATSLMRMRNAESPLLRNRIADVAKMEIGSSAGRSRDGEPLQEDEKIVENLEVLVWRNLIANSQVPRVRRMPPERRHDADSPIQSDSAADTSGERSIGDMGVSVAIPQELIKESTNGTTISPFPTETPSPTPWIYDDWPTQHNPVISSGLESAVASMPAPTVRPAMLLAPTLNHSIDLFSTSGTAHSPANGLCNLYGSPPTSSPHDVYSPPNWQNTQIPIYGGQSPLPFYMDGVTSQSQSYFNL